MSKPGDFQFTDFLHEDFQVQVLGLLLQDMDFLARSRGVIRPEYFSQRWMRVVLTALYARWDAEHLQPPIMTLRSELAKAASDEPTLNAWVHNLNLVYTLPAEDIDRPYIEENVANFAQRAEAAQAVKNAALDLAHFDIGEFTREVERIALLPSVYFRLGASIREDWIDTTMEDNRQIFITGCEGLDAMLRGGLREGELLSFLAPLKGGKSMVLHNMAVWYLIAGYGVLFITLEMYELDVLKRIVSIFSDVPSNELQDENHFGKVKTYMQHLDRITGGQLVIKDFPGSTLTVKQLEGHMKLVEAKVRKKVIPIIDYADRMLPEHTRGKEEWQMLPELYDALRYLGKRHEVPVITATQTNVQGFTATKLGAQHQRGASGKGMVADYMPAINQSPDDYALNRFAIDLVLARHARKHTTAYFSVNYPTGRIREISEKAFLNLGGGKNKQGPTL